MKAGEQVRRIVVDMQNSLFADAIARTLKNTESDFEVYQSKSPDKTAELCGLTLPYALIMETTGRPPQQLPERLKLAGEALAIAPHCKIVLVVDENAEKKLAAQVRQAKKDGLIDQFIYGSISAEYLVAVIDTL